MLRSAPTRLIAVLAVLALLGVPWGVLAQTADEAAALERLARKHRDEEQWLNAEKAYLDALKVYQDRLAREHQNDALLLRWCQCRNELGAVQCRLLKLREAQALFAMTGDYLRQVIPLRRGEPAFRLALAKTHQTLSSSYLHLQRFEDAEAQQQKALETLRGLTKDHPGKTEYRLALAQALKHRGAIMTSLARFADADKAYAEAAAIARQLVAEAPAIAEFALELALIYASHGMLLRESGGFAQAALMLRAAAPLLAKLEADHPERPELWGPLPMVYRNLVQSLSYLGRVAEAEAASREAARVDAKLATLPPAARKGNADIFQWIGSLVARDADRLKNESDAIEKLSHTNADAPAPKPAAYLDAQRAAQLNVRGLQLAARGSRDEACKQFQQAIDQMKKLDEPSADMPIIRTSLAELYLNLGITCLKDGALELGDRNLRLGLGQLQQLAREHPHAPYFRYLMGDHLLRVAIALNALNRVKEAARYRSETQAVLKALADDYPTCPLYRRLYAQGQSALYRMLLADRAEPQAESALREGIRLWAKVCTDFPATPDFRKSWAKELGTLGQYLIYRERPQDAQVAFAEMLKINQKLLSEHAREPDYHVALAIAHLWLAHVHEKQDRSQESVAEDTQAIAFWESALQLDPRQRQWLSELRAAVQHRARGYLKLQKQAEYLGDLQRAKELTETLDTPLFRLYRIEERGQKAETVPAALREADDLFQNVELNKVEWNRLALFYVDVGKRTANGAQKDAMLARAVVALRQALQRGYPRSLMRQDTQLTPLAVREDFRRLMQER